MTDEAPKWRPWVSLSPAEQVLAQDEHRAQMRLDRPILCPHCGQDVRRSPPEPKK